MSGDPCNRGQYMGNKPSTRVHAAPGGNSSISLGWGGSDKPTPKPNYNAIDKQQVYNCEVGGVPRKAPEGSMGHLLQGGGGPPGAVNPNQQPQQQQQFQPQQQQFQQPQQQQFQQEQQFQPQQPQQQQQFQPQQQQFQQPQQQQQQAPMPGASNPVSSNRWASNASQNSGNMLSERPSTRIHAPPGGKSSITF